MKMRTLLLSVALVGVSAAAAQAEINVGIGFSEPQPFYPAYTAAEPIYLHNDHHERARHYDWNYWNHQHGPVAHHDERFEDHRR